MSETNEGEQVTAEAVGELKNKIATLEQEKSNVVGELQDDRKKRQELADEVDTLKATLAEAIKKPASTDPNDIVSQVEQLLEKKLGERDASVAKSNKVTAIERFVSEHKEFDAANDTTGKRREALETALSRLNLTGLTSETDFYAAVVDASRLLGTNTTPTNPVENKVDSPFSSTVRTPHEPKTTTDGTLSDTEESFIKRAGISKEKYAAIKLKDPKYAENLLRLSAMG